MLDQKTSGMTLARWSRNSGSCSTGTDVAEGTTTANPPPDCEEQGRQIREALYDNKHDRIDPNTGRLMGGNGYLRRMIEQMCGASGPGTSVWIEHENQLTGERNNLVRARNVLNSERNECNIQEQVSRTDRLLVNQILNQDGWTPDSIQWVGRNGPRCANWESIARGDDLGEIIRAARALAGI